MIFDFSRGPEIDPIDRKPATSGYTLAREGITLHVWPIEGIVPVIALVIADAPYCSGTTWTAPFVNVLNVDELDEAHLHRLFCHYVLLREAA